jgi:hypothetical protein
MNHPFIKSSLESADTPLLQQKCASCKYDRISHTSKAICEVCGKQGDCDLFMTILMCSECAKKEAIAQEESKATADDRVEKLREDYKNVTSLSYYNAQITPIAELKELYELNGHKFEEFHARIKDQILHFSKALFEAQVESKPDEISNLLIEFRAEIRTKLKERDIKYTPPTKAPKVPKPKSAMDKAAAMLVAVAEREGKTLTLEEAKARLYKELGI